MVAAAAVGAAWVGRGAGAALQEGLAAAGARAACGRSKCMEERVLVQVQRPVTWCRRNQPPCCQFRVQGGQATATLAGAVPLLLPAGAVAAAR